MPHYDSSFATTSVCTSLALPLRNTPLRIKLRSCWTCAHLCWHRKSPEYTHHPKRINWIHFHEPFCHHGWDINAMSRYGDKHHGGPSFVSTYGERVEWDSGHRCPGYELSPERILKIRVHSTPVTLVR